MKKLLLALVLLACGPAAAQWQVPTGNIPLGRGPGVVGFQGVFPDAIYADAYIPTGATRTQTTAGLNAALTKCSSNGGGVVLLGSSYFTNDQIVVPNACELKGMGKQATVINFLPTVNNKAAIYMNGSPSSGPIRITGMTIYSSDTTFVKLGIICIDCRDVEIDHVAISGVGTNSTWHDATNASVGIQLYGRDGYNIHDIASYADLPFRLQDNPNLTGSIIDQSHFWNITVYSSVSNLVTIAGGLVTNMTWDGTQEWLGGTTGLRWLDTASVTFNSVGNTFKNIRFEQTFDATAWSFDIEGNAAANVYIGVAFENITGGDRKGWKLRNVTNVNLKQSHFLSTFVGYDIDASVYGFTINDSFWLNGVTASIVGQNLVGPLGFGVSGTINLDASTTIPSTASYEKSTGVRWIGNFGALSANGNSGLSTTKTVRASGGAADCTLIYTSGLLTGGSC